MGEHTTDAESDNRLPREIIIQRYLPEEDAGACMQGETTPVQKPGLPGLEDFKQNLEEKEGELKERIRSDIRRLAPLDVMMSAMSYMRLVCMGRQQSIALGEDRDGIDELHDNNALLVPEYLQSSLVVLDKPGTSGRASDDADRQAALAELFDSCEELIEIGRPLKMARAMGTLGGDGHEDAVERFQLESKLYEDLRGKRYQALEEPYLRYLVEGQDSLIREIYGVGGGEVVDGAVALMDSLVKGWQSAMEEAASLCNELDALDQEDQEVMERFQRRIDESGLPERLQGQGLFDVKTVTGWPDSLIDDLTLDAFSGPEAAGVRFEDLSPVEALPIRKRPFIRIDGKPYCFCYANYLDNFYRALYDAARRRYALQHPRDARSFGNRWNEAQAKASEHAVADLFGRLLPGAVVVRNSYHPLSGTVFNRKRYGESDIVIRYEDVLLSVEVKGGSYCPTDPIDDPEGHVRSMKDLIEKAAKQAQSTVDYVKRCSGSTCRLYDKDSSVLYEFDPADINLFFKVCITVDDVNEFATKIEKTGVVDVPEGTIALSIDDLLVYERYFDNPLVFLHFLLERRRAANNPSVRLNDELDHLGYYSWTNCYSEHISRETEEMAEGGQANVAIVPEGLRDRFNDWFQGLYTGENYPKPVPESPAAFDKIIAALFELCDSPCRRRTACSLLDLGSDTRESIAASIRARMSSLRAVPANSMIEIPAASDDDVAISLFVSSPSFDCDWDTCRLKTISGMITKGEKERVAMLCTWSGPEEVVDCKIELLKEAEVTESERIASSSFDFGMRTMRQNAARTLAGRKVGRNEPCPCGSGKKFKRCCGR